MTLHCQRNLPYGKWRWAIFISRWAAGFPWWFAVTRAKIRHGAQSLAGIGPSLQMQPLAWDVLTLSIDSTFSSTCVWRVTSHCGWCKCIIKSSHHILWLACFIICIIKQRYEFAKAPPSSLHRNAPCADSNINMENLIELISAGRTDAYYPTLRWKDFMNCE